MKIILIRHIIVQTRLNISGNTNICLAYSLFYGAALRKTPLYNGEHYSSYMTLKHGCVFKDTGEGFDFCGYFRLETTKIWKSATT